MTKQVINSLQTFFHRICATTDVYLHTQSSEPLRDNSISGHSFALCIFQTVLDYLIFLYCSYTDILI